MMKTALENLKAIVCDTKFKNAFSQDLPLLILSTIVAGLLFLFLGVRHSGKSPSDPKFETMKYWEPK